MKNIKNISFLLFVLTFSLAIFSCGGDKSKKAEDNRPIVKAKLARAGGATVGEFITISGKIRAEKSANIAARMMGNITDIKIKVGDRVSKGQLLATINNTDIQSKIAQTDAGIDEANTALRNIEKNFKRVQSLFEKNSATRKELDDITAQRDMMQAKLKQAQEMKNELKAMLSFSNIKAPFTGTITEKHANSGDLASPGRPLFTIEEAGDFQAEAMVPENQIVNIAKGEKVNVIIKSTGTEINGKISEISSSSLNTGGQYLTRIDLDKNDLKGVKLFSGMFVNVVLPNKNVKKNGEKTTVNKNAIISEGQLTGIYTVSENNTAILRWVRLGKPHGDQIEVLSGISSGENYITEFEGRLTNGAKVEVN